jgi:hypothetical protein
VDLNSGHLILDSTVTNGTIVVRGVGHITDESTGSTDLQNAYLVDAEQLASPGDPMTLTASERNAVANALLDLQDGVELDFTPREILRLMASVLLGTSSGAGTNNIRFKSVTGAKTRVQATMSSDDDRLTIVFDKS